MRRHLRTLLLSALIVAPALHAQEMQHFESHYENVLGTTLDLSMYAPDMAQMEAAAEAAVAEIARMDAIVSNYRADSEVMRLNRERMVTGASQELLDIVELCAQWERQTQKRFSCKLGRIIALWNEAERTQQLPDRMELQRLAL